MSKNVVGHGVGCGAQVARAQVVLGAREGTFRQYAGRRVEQEEALAGTCGGQRSRRRKPKHLCRPADFLGGFFGRSQATACPSSLRHCVSL